MGGEGMKWGILITLPDDAIPEEALESIAEFLAINGHKATVEITEVLE